MSTKEPDRDPEFEPTQDAGEPQPAPEARPEREGVQEVEATPIDEREAATGPTIDAPPPPGREGADGAGPRSAKFNQWAMFTHLAGLASIPFLYVGGILGPLIVWQIKDSEEPGLAAHGKEAINFQINMLVWTLILSAAAVVFSYLCCCFAWVPVAVLQAYNVALTVIAALRANEGTLYRYPGIVRILD